MQCPESRTDYCAKIQRFRAHGLDVVAAVDLVADQHDLDPEQLAVDHFAWLMAWGAQISVAHR